MILKNITTSNNLKTNNDRKSRKSTRGKGSPADGGKYTRAEAILQILREDTGWDWSEKEDIKRYFKDQVTCCLQFEYVIEKCTNEKALVSN